MSRREALLEYHERSKHRLDRYAPGPGRLDWANQPNPFREFEGAPRVALPHAAEGLPTRYNALRRGDLPPSSPFDLRTLSILLELSLAISAWKSYAETRWALRCNPSSGNLHPTEGYVVCGALPGLAPGVHHYVSRDHALEHRARVELPLRDGVLVGLTAIYWREAWKYGMRAWRYCAQDCGHAIAALGYAAAALGWQARLLHAPSDEAVSRLLGLDRDDDFGEAEREAPEVLLWIGDPASRPEIGPLLDAVPQARWHGRANRLSDQHVGWRDIDRAHDATRKPATEAPESFPGMELRPPADPAVDLPFQRIARQRRSAVDFDGVTRIEAPQFCTMLAGLLPRPATAPWNAFDALPRVHPAMLVHRVDGLEPGLYALLRDAGVLERMRAAMRPEWLWRKAGPAHLPLYLLLPHDLRPAARLVCCHQDIAADSCFALGFLGEFALAENEPWRYRHLHWEAGAAAHVLYLEAEAAGIRATGIGCFFDDEMHSLLGLRDREWQSMYHFTAGGPVEDRRLTTLPPY